LKVSAPKIAAIVPMRHTSERVPGKNYRSFAGKPLFHHIILSLLGCIEVDEILIDTDSEIIRESACSAFPGVRVLERPESLRSGFTPMNDVLLHTTSCAPADFYLQTHCTNPLLTTATISRAIRQFLDNLNDHDSLFSVKRLQVRLWDQQGQPINHDPDELIRTQDLPPVYEENSCIYLFSRETLLARKNRIGANPLLFEMDPIESWDIDEEADFQIAEILYQNREQRGGPCP
jgi:CMP-N-acetylneuraminic acid synthetase